LNKLLYVLGIHALGMFIPPTWYG